MELNDETLMAFADGELDAGAAAQVRAAIGADPALAARVELFRQSRRAVASAHAGLAAAPVPDPIADRIRQLAAQARTARPETAQSAQAGAAPKVQTMPSNVVAMPQRRQVPLWQLPLAASIALVAGLSASQFMFQAAGGGGSVATILGDPGLSQVLAQVPAGSRQPLDSGAEVALIATFENADGGLCREFEYDQPSGVTTVAVACRATGDAAEDWQVQLAIVADAGATGYAPASSLEVLDSWMISTGAGAPLSAEDEAAALNR